MTDFIKDKLHVEYEKGMEEDESLDCRKYTLTHSDETGELFLYVGENYAWDRLTNNRDDVLGEWIKVADKAILRINLHIDGIEVGKSIEERNEIFRRELPLALKAIVYGDRRIYISRKELINTPIIVYFNSENKNFNKVERWGQIKDYIIGDLRSEKRPNFLDGRLKDNLIIALLRPYVEKELKKLYGDKYILCDNFSQILSVVPMKAPFTCSGSYIVTVGIKSGFNMMNQNINNVIIEFNVTSDGVKVKSVKNPR